MDFQIQPCTSEQFMYVKDFIRLFELDDRELKSEQFLVAIQQQNIIGFGRIREHASCSEMCSLGVIEPIRNRGVGVSLAKALIQKAQKPLYLACIIPHYFEKLGFAITDVYPAEMKSKLDYCTNSLVVPETYVVMKKADSIK